MQKAADDERHLQLTMRSIANGVISERDRLFEYTTGEFYQELSLFIQESDIRKKELEEMKRKK